MILTSTIQHCFAIIRLWKLTINGKHFTIDNENLRLVLTWDYDVWTKQNESFLPVLKHTGKARGAIMLRAEEYDPDSEEWYEIARDSYYVSTIFDKDAECSHIWETFIKRIKKEII